MILLERKRANMTTGQTRKNERNDLPTKQRNTALDTVVDPLLWVKFPYAGNLVVSRKKK